MSSVTSNTDTVQPWWSYKLLYHVYLYLWPWTSPGKSQLCWSSLLVQTEIFVLHHYSKMPSSWMQRNQELLCKVFWAPTVSGLKLHSQLQTFRHWPSLGSVDGLHWLSAVRFWRCRLCSLVIEYWNSTREKHVHERPQVAIHSDRLI